jgi:DNA repair photolyase
MDAWFGVSLVWTDDRQRQKYEPDASTVTERLDTLSLAKSKGIVTWASVEPVIDQQQALRAIELLAPVADIIKVGRINHDARLGMQDWRSFAVESWKLVTALGKNYYFKKGLREYLTNPENL